MKNCPGLELEPEDHRVLRQLTMDAVGFEHQCKLARLKTAPSRLNMDYVEWYDIVQRLIDRDLIVREDGKLFVVIQCECRDTDVPPEWRAKPLPPTTSGPVNGGGWRRLSLAQRETPSERDERCITEGVQRTSPRGGGAPSVAPIVISQQLPDVQSSGSAKTLRTDGLRTATTAPQPRAKSGTSSADLRMAFKEKFDKADILNRLGLGYTRVLDKRKDCAFTSALGEMRNTMKMSPERILSMMDVFMAMVLAGQIDIRGKHVWQVFVARRGELFERVERDRKIGSSAGKMAELAKSRAKALDRLSRDRLDKRSPRRRR